MNTTPRRPRVKIREALVLVHCAPMGSFHLYKMNAAGKISLKAKELVAIADTPQEACRAMGVTFAGFEAVNGMAGRKFPDAATQVEAIWKAAQVNV